MKYELLLLDADDTLFDFNRCMEEALVTSFSFFGLPYADGHFQVYKELNRAAWQAYERREISQQELKTLRFERLFAQLNMEMDSHRFSDHYLDQLAQQNFVFEGVDEVLAQLHEQHTIAIVTNGIHKVQLGRLGSTLIRRHIDYIITSEEIGHPKPHKAIFEHSFSVAGHQRKDTALMVGDNLMTDILGGFDFGIHTCWYNPGSIANESSVVPTFEIQALSQLLDIVA